MMSPSTTLMRFLSWGCLAHFSLAFVPHAVIASTSLLHGDLCRVKGPRGIFDKGIAVMEPEVGGVSGVGYASGKASPRELKGNVDTHSFRSQVMFVEFPASQWLVARHKPWMVTLSSQLPPNVWRRHGRPDRQSARGFQQFLVDFIIASPLKLFSPPSHISKPSPHHNFLPFLDQRLAYPSLS